MLSKKIKENREFLILNEKNFDIESVHELDNRKTCEKLDDVDVESGDATSISTLSWPSLTRVKSFYSTPSEIDINDYCDKFKNQMNYFSKKMRKYLNDKEDKCNGWKPKRGKYKNCVGSIVKEIPVPHYLNGVTSLQFSKFGDIAIVGHGSGSIRLINLDTDLTFNVKPSFENESITNLKIYPKNDDWIFASTKNDMYLCQLNVERSNNNFKTFESKCFEKLFKGESSIEAMDIDVYGNALITGGSDGCIYIYDPVKGAWKNKYNCWEQNCERLKKYTGPDLIDSGHSKTVQSLKFHPTQRNIFISGSWDCSVKIWDLRVQSYPVRNIYGPRICGPNAIDICNYNILTAQWTKCKGIQLWDMRTSELLITLNPNVKPRNTYGDYYYCAKFFKTPPENETLPTNYVEGDIILAGGSGRGAMEIFSLKMNKALINFIEYDPIVSIAQFGTDIIFGGTGNLLHYVQFHLNAKRIKRKIYQIPSNYEPIANYMLRQTDNKSKTIQEE